VRIEEVSTLTSDLVLHVHFQKLYACIKMIRQW